MSEAPCLKVHKTLGARAISLATGLGLANRCLKVERVDDHLCIPLIREPSQVEMERLKEALLSFEVITYWFSERPKQHPDIVSVLQDKLPPHLLASLPHAIDFIGTIAVVEIPPKLNNYKRVVGEAILAMNRRLRTVLAKASPVCGIYRVRAFEVIAGVEETETVHKEYDCIFHVDLAKAYFSPRLSHEHDRISSQIGNMEIIIDMFAGVGPFSILIAKRHKNAQVYAIDINPDAVDYLKRNIIENNVEKNVVPILGDARQIIEERFLGVSNRVIMNLPEKAIEYVDAACKALKPEDGILHFYTFESEPKPLESASERLTEAVKQTQRNLEKILLTRLVRATSPFVWQVAVDAKVR